VKPGSPAAVDGQKPRSFPALAAWLYGKRHALERRIADELGQPIDPGALEFEALRRFRSFAIASLRGVPAAPALDGLRVVPQEAESWIDAWLRAAVAEAGRGGDTVARNLTPLVERFKGALRATPRARASAGRRRGRRRFVSAAIDRVSLAFFAIDCDDGAILDANPAASLLLGEARDALLGSSFSRWLAVGELDEMEAELDAVAEGEEQRRFRCTVVGTDRRRVQLDVHVTRYVRRGRVVALAVAYPTSPALERGAL
ncbi:MAG: PAS domain-containing protein, partial [Myxococcales bacterium]|nr:PAS domain-containing protein [Myxococcales bacterium]